MDMRDIWLAVLGELQLQLHPAIYRTWVDGARLLSLENDVAVIAVENDYIRDWLQERLLSTFQRSAARIMRRPIELQFVVEPKEETFFADFGLFSEDEPRATTQSEAASLNANSVEKSPLVFAQGEVINHDYYLDNFVAGASNQLAFAAAEAIVNANSRLYNPFFIYGGVGMGKTHLLHAIGNALDAAGKKVLCVNAETFTNDMIRAIRIRQTEAFRDFYRSVDALLVDDIQFIIGKESTQEEFFHTFNTLYNRGCQIVLTGNCKPSEMEGLQERLRSRFDGGLTAELRTADYEMRLQIVLNKAAAQDFDMPDDVADLLANRLRMNNRELVGGVNRVLARSALMRHTPTRETADAILRDAPLETARPPLELQDILEITAQYHQLTLDDLLSKHRSKDVANARHIAIYLAREEIQATLPEIGRALGGRTHSTILNSYHKIANRIAIDPIFKQDIALLRKQLYQR